MVNKIDATDEQLGSLLKKVRKAKGLSQKKLSTLTGISQTQYRNIESGKTDPTFSVVVKIAKVLEIKVLQTNEISSDPEPYDSTLKEKINLLNSLDHAEKKALYKLIDSIASKNKFKDSLSKLVLSTITENET